MNIFLPTSLSIWTQIVKNLSEHNEYEALSILTTGVCDTCQIPHTVIHKSANISGLLKFLIVGKMTTILADKEGMLRIKICAYPFTPVFIFLYYIYSLDTFYVLQSPFSFSVLCHWSIFSGHFSSFVAASLSSSFLSFLACSAEKQRRN